MAAITRWLGRIKSGSVIAESFWSADILVACAILSGIALPEDIVIDGKNPLPLLTGGARSPHESFYFEYRQHAALRKGNWKIVRERPDQAWQLFHLTDDKQESRNLARDDPEKVNELQDAFRTWRAALAPAKGKRQ